MRCTHHPEPHRSRPHHDCCFQWTVWAHSIWFPAQQCSQDCSTWRRRNGCCHSCGCFVRSRRLSWRDPHHPAKGGEQGDALMPLLFTLGQQRALRAIAGELQAGERFFAFLDDLYVSCQPARVAPIHRSMRIELWRHSKISVHHGKTKLWNEAVLPQRSGRASIGFTRRRGCRRVERQPIVADVQARNLDPRDADRPRRFREDPVDGTTH